MVQLIHGRANSLSLQIEYYKFMSFPHPDYALVAWCATGPLVDHNGAFVLARGAI